MTADRYGHLFPSGDDGAELVAAEQAFLGPGPYLRGSPVPGVDRRRQEGARSRQARAIPVSVQLLPARTASIFPPLCPLCVSSNLAYRPRRSSTLRR